MKALLLPILSLALLSTGAMAQTTVTKTKATTTTTSASNNQYRSIPRGSESTGKQRFRVAAFKPTQHYYLRDNVISYRYGAELSFSGTVDAGSYMGPQGAVFIPEAETLPASASIRNFASVTRRTQPGVGMAPAASKKTAARASTPASRFAAK